MYAGYYGQASAAVPVEICPGARITAARVKETLSDLIGLAITAFVIITMLAAIVLLPGAKRPAPQNAVAVSGEAVASTASGDIVLLSDSDNN